MKNLFAVLLVAFIAGCTTPPPQPPPPSPTRLPPPIPGSPPLTALFDRPRPLVATLTAATGSSVTLAWSPPASGSVIGYQLHWGPATQTYTNFVDTGSATNATVNVVPGSTYFFAATAYNGVGQSPYSAEVSYTAPPQAKTNTAWVIRGFMQTNGILASANSGTWTNAYAFPQVTIPLYANPEFFQVLIQMWQTNSP